MESLAREKFNSLKSRFFSKEPNSHVNGGEGAGLLFSNNGATGTRNSLSTSGGAFFLDETDEDNNAVGLVLQKFSSLKSRFFNKSEYRNAGENDHIVSAQHEHGASYTGSNNDAADVGVDFHPKRELNEVFRDNFHKLKNKFFQSADDDDEHEELVQNALLSSETDWRDSSLTGSTRNPVLTRSTDVRNFFTNDSESDEGVDGLNNGVPPGPGLNFFDSCVEDEDDTEIELFSFPEEKCEILCSLLFISLSRVGWMNQSEMMKWMKPELERQYNINQKAHEPEVLLPQQDL